MLFSGEEEGAVKIWDLRNLSSPLAVGSDNTTEPIYDFENVSNNVVSCSSGGVVNVSNEKIIYLSNTIFIKYKINFLQIWN